MRPAQRQLRKLRKRGHVATPKLVIPDSVMQPGDTEWMPGIPAFHTGTAAMHGPSGSGAVEHGMTPDQWLRHLDSQGISDTGGGATTTTTGGTPRNGEFRQTDVGGGFFVWEQYFDGQWFPTSQPQQLPAGVSGGGTSLSDSLTILGQQQEFEQRQAELDRLIDENKISAQQAIARGDRISAERIQEQARFMEALQLQYAQERDNLDRQIAQQGLNQNTRQQDINQRDTDISAGLQGSDQTLRGLTSSGQQFGSLAALEQDRQARLQNLAANPRDFMEMNFALGNGQSFLNELALGRSPGGQSATTGLDPLGASRGSLNDLIAQLNQTPAFDAAFNAAGNLGDFQPPALPGQVAGPGPGAELTPAQQQVFQQIRASAPDLPIDIALDMARRPGAFRQLFEGLGGGQSTGGSSTGGGATGGQNGALFNALPAFMADIQSRSPNLTAADAQIFLQYQQLFQEGNPQTAAAFGELANITLQVSNGTMAPDDAIGAYIRAFDSMGLGQGNTSGQARTIDGSPEPTFPPGTNIDDIFPGLFPQSPTGGAPQAQTAFASKFQSQADAGFPTAPFSFNPFTPASQHGTLTPEEFISFREANPTGLPSLNQNFQGLEGSSFVPQPIQFDRFGLPLGGTTVDGTSFGHGFQPGAPRLEGITDIVGTRGGDAFGAAPGNEFLTPRDTPEFQTSLDAYIQFLNSQGIATGDRGPALQGGLTPIEEAPGINVGTPTTSTRIGDNVSRALSGAERINLSKFKAASGSVTDRARSAGILPSLAGGGDVLVDEPSAIVGLQSGKTFATLGEPTQQFPGGIPELVAPQGNGISVTPPGKGNFSQRLMNLVSVPRLAHGGIVKGPIPDFQIEDNDATQGGFQPPPIVQLPAPPAPVPGATPFDPAGLAEIPPEGVFGAPVQQQQFDPGALLRNLLSQRPDAYYGLTPDQTDQLFSVTSALGIPRRTAQFSIERSFPGGIDPSQITTAGFSRGGYIRVA